VPLGTPYSIPKGEKSSSIYSLDKTDISPEKLAFFPVSTGMTLLPSFVASSMLVPYIIPIVKSEQTNLAFG